MVTLYPEISADVGGNFLRQPMHALILRSYGVGDALQHLTLLHELKQADERGIVMINLTQCLSVWVDIGVFADGNALACAGVLSGFDITVEAALTKLYFLLSQSLPYQAIRRLIQQDLRDELSSSDTLEESYDRSIFIV